MAINDRATNQTTIDNNLPDNTTEAITPALHREVETDLNDSCFNKIDEPRAVSGTIAYVDENGDDLTAVIGDQSKPFATIRAAWEGTPTNNVIIKALGGTYTESNLDFVTASKTNFILDLSSVTLNVTDSNGLRPRGSQKGTIILHGAVLNCPLSLGADSASEISVYGGIINGTLNVGEKSYVQGCEINSSSFAVISEISSIDQRAYFSNCRITATGSNPAVTAVATFANCFIQGLNTAYQPSSINTLYSRFINCTLRTTGTSNATIFGTSAILNGVFKQCRIESQGGKAVEVGGGSASNPSLNAFFEDCEIIASTDCVNINANLLRAATTRTTFKRCSFYTNTGEIITGTPSGSDLGKTSLIGTTLTNKAILGGLINFEVLGDQLTVTDAQTPSF